MAAQEPQEGSGRGAAPPCAPRAPSPAPSTAAASTSTCGGCQQAPAQCAPPQRKKQPKQPEQQLQPHQLQRRPGQCGFFLTGGSKRRFCRLDAIAGQGFCGNHLHLGLLATNGVAPHGPPGAAAAAIDGGGGGGAKHGGVGAGAAAAASAAVEPPPPPALRPAPPRRVPCPIDPTHDVPEPHLLVHVRRCPRLLEERRERAQPHYVEDANAGSDEEPLLPPPPASLLAARQPLAATAEARLRAVLDAAAAATADSAAAVAAAATGAANADAAPLATAQAAGAPLGSALEAPAPTEAPAPAAATEAAAAATAAAAAAPAGPSGGLVAALGPFERGRAAQRAALARSLGADAFSRLLQRVEAAHAAAYGRGPPPAHVLRPAECEALLAAPSDRGPYDLKHALQQASILGNMQRVGLLEPGPQGGAGVAVVEVGAGKGYLGATLAAAAGVRHLIATDIKSGMRLKADRHMRHIAFARHRVDLKDYVPAATPELVAAAARSHDLGPSVAAAPTAGERLDGSASASGACLDNSTTSASAHQAAVPVAAVAPAPRPHGGVAEWVAVGKHVCGAATDFALRACLKPPPPPPPPPPPNEPAPHGSDAGDGPQPLGGSAAGGGGGGGGGGDGVQGRRQRRRQRQRLEGQGGGLGADGPEGSEAAAGRGHADAAGRATDKAAAGAAATDSAAAGAANAAAAGAPGGPAAGSAIEASCTRGGQQKRPELAQGRAEGEAAKCARVDADAGEGHTSVRAATHGAAAAVTHGPALRGLAIAPCCHHRCGWRAYVGKPLFRQLGLGPAEFELISWMTGWALCGHDVPAGSASACGSGDDSDGACDEGRAPGNGSGDATPPASAPPPPAPTTDAGDTQQQKQQQQHSNGHERAAPPPPSTPLAAAASWFDPASALPRARRMAVGMLCKELIEAGRLEWLSARYGTAELVSYVAPEVTGENRLLLAVRPHAAPSAGQ